MDSRKRILLPPELAEMAKDWEPAMAGLKKLSAELQEANAGIYAQMAKVAADWRDAMSFLRERLPDIQRGMRRFEQDAESLAELGWSVPSCITPAEVSEIVSLANPEKVDSAMEQLYVEDNMRMFRATVSELQSSVFIHKWRSLLQQIAVCIERGLYLVAGPSLLLILEGYVTQFAQPHRKRSKDIRRLLKQAQPSDRATILVVMWRGTSRFIDKLFAPSDFQGTQPSFINRHWILHGRSADNWTRADALRLLNTLSTLDWFRQFSVRAATQGSCV